MGLQPGVRIGPYEVAALIGAGGMGEVYKARDTRLQRDVAIKVLPEAFARDGQRMARFEREARMLASLNHPNIAAIYGLEESGPIRALVMELVEGPTLADRIKSGPEKLGVNSVAKGQSGGAMPIDEALPIARQVADAVEYAHEKNVIHRDLKPANIKVTLEGTVKVLDFGLAKAMADDPSEGDMSNSPTLSMAATRQGMILGTAAYMSPEQAKGRTVDRRADIWAFGCVLFEMLTGKQAFHGEDITEVLAAVVKSEPAFDALPANTPPAIRTLLRRCLRKDRRERLPDAGAARIEIQDALSAPATAEAGAAAPVVRRDRAAWVMAAIALAAALALGIPAVMHLSETPPAEMRTEIVTPSTTDPTSFALSPDGRQIVFVASGDGPARLWLRRLEMSDAQPLAGTEGARYPFWSPDSRSVGFFAEGRLKRTNIDGGSPQTLASTGGPRGGTWGPDGTILYTTGAASPLFRVSATGGEPVAATKLDNQTSHRFPQFLPGGRQFLFYAVGTPETAGIYLGSVDSSATKRVTAADTAGLYSPGGRLLLIRAGTLFAQRLDLERGELTGDPVTVADAVTYDSSSFAGGFSVSAGLIAYRRGEAGQRQLMWFDRSGKMLGALGAPDANGLSSPSVSPDGRRAAVHRAIQGNTDIWLLDGTRTTRFTFDASLDRYPAWSPDGSRIVFESNRKGVRDLYIKPSNGAGSEELLLESAQTKTDANWSRDGRFLLYYSNDPETAFDLWVLPMQGDPSTALRATPSAGSLRGSGQAGQDRKPFVFLKTNFDERRPQFSPDGRWVAYRSNESGRFEVYVRPFNGTSSATGGQWQVSTSGGIDPRWRADGRELYYIAPDGKLMAAPISDQGTTIAPGAPVALFQTRIYGGGTDPNTGFQYDVSRDGRFLINTVLEEAASPITLLQSWNPEATR